jgi:hypothetical protein
MSDEQEDVEDEDDYEDDQEEDYKHTYITSYHDQAYQLSTNCACARDDSMHTAFQSISKPVLYFADSYNRQLLNSFYQECIMESQGKLYKIESQSKSECAASISAVE